VIQVSTPIQTQNSSGSEPDAVPVESQESKKSRKNDKLGVFAKLLEGLTGKAKNRRAGKNDHTTINRTEETQLFSGLKKTKGSAGKGETNALTGENSPQVLALLGQDRPITRQNSVFKPEFDLESAGSALKKAEPPEAGADGGDKIFSFRSQFSETDPMPREQETQEGGLFPFKDTAKAEETEAGSSSRLILKGDYRETKTGGSGRGVVDMLPASARNVDGKPYQFAGAPRPALVDSLSAAPEEAPVGRLAESRKKGRERLNSGPGNVKTGEIREAGVSEAVKSPGFGGTEKIDLEIQAEIRTEPGLKGRGEGADFGKAGNSWNQGLEDSLALELRENLGADIVKQASILVRNQQEGTIRLTLKPETLGNIKIRLEMAENKITGHIVVESSEALKAFERELPVLEKAFRDSGFSEANLDMSMAWNGESYDREQEGGNFTNLSRAQAAFRYDAGTAEGELIPEGFFPENPGKKVVNMLV
jgi:hypothetical protein